MARVNLPITYLTTAGVNQAAQVTGNSTENHVISENAGKVFIEAENTNAAATATVTLVANKEEPGGLKVENLAITLAKSGESGAKKLIGPLPPTVVNQNNGVVNVNVSSTEVKFRVYSL